MLLLHSSAYFFFFNDTATTEIYTLSLHDALPIFGDDDRVASRHDGHAGVRCPKIDSDDFTHGLSPSAVRASISPVRPGIRPDCSRRPSPSLAAARGHAGSTPSHILPRSYWAPVLGDPPPPLPDARRDRRAVPRWESA